ncbi:hypothetical protein OHA72_51500 [Dactylosporangium sp. NBC_01737]|uniref:hypothetical protein n=1 Tax=Dactylosporangium sp. NBC_01737 TaxID=2975959 RepID=UPI002E0E5674|nr:hypothetical protein OHA72_51500 [Dactylosporangium sp. NBC_01737]
MGNGRSWGILLFLAALGVFGLLTACNAGAFLAGFGPQRTVYVDSVRTDEIPTTDGSGMPIVTTVRVGEGYYLDGGGRRHAVELTGFAGEPGDVVRTRGPLLPGWLALAPHRTGQAVGMLLLGLFLIAAGGGVGTFLYLELD